MRIYHNMEALNAWRTLSNVKGEMSKSLEKLSSGLRINRAADDAAGLAISEKMRNQIKGLNTAIRNAQDAISMIQTAEGALDEVHSILKRMRELAVQSSTDTNTDVDRDQLQNEFTELRNEINRIAKTTQFNTKNLLDGSIRGTRSAEAKLVSPGSAHFEIKSGGNLNSIDVNANVIIEVGQFAGGATSQLDVKVTVVKEDGTIDTSTSIVSVNANSITVDIGSGSIIIGWDQTQISKITDYGGTLASGTKIDGGAIAVYGLVTAGANGVNPIQYHIGANEGQVISLGFESMKADNIGIVSSLKINSQSDAEFAVSAIDAAIYKVSAFRAKLGAAQNRLEHTIKNLGVASENLTAAESRIRDADMAKEYAEYTKQQILLQSGTAMLSQANQLPQQVTQLFR
ncbi:flagellin/flagellar hook associated protein [Marinitoga piezophila KA3]|uniref:Flagellin n=1 Tax=Marinitoga piezophila (strain DSM 14283 / JCM 11233 / KA3) TaxID=443254 RepID=H2J4A6_MARPK|nr:MULTISPECIES: flagellin [Marinitoga]AEX85921.1 flagellin/flagellar hook associated protein [Marinitoga piezophila KA3]APT76351.1 flagellin [Marinitoga sp. 1137]